MKYVIQWIFSAARFSKQKKSAKITLLFIYIFNHLTPWNTPLQKSHKREVSPNSSHSGMGRKRKAQLLHPLATRTATDCLQDKDGGWLPRDAAASPSWPLLHSPDYQAASALELPLQWERVGPRHLQRSFLIQAVLKLSYNHANFLS